MTTIALEDVHVDGTGDRQVVGGVDTHKDTHTAAVIDATGRLLGSRQFAATGAGYRVLLRWLRSFGTLLLVGSVVSFLIRLTKRLPSIVIAIASAGRLVSPSRA